MNGYQPIMRCNNCLKYNDCKKAREGKEACKKFEARPMTPPKSGSNAQTPKYTPPPMPEVKPPKQRTVLSVRDFAILYEIIERELSIAEFNAQYPYLPTCQEKDREKIVERNVKAVQNSREYKDLLRIREKLGELNIEIEAPSVEVEEC